MPCTSTKPLPSLPRSTSHDLMPKDPTGRRLFSIFEYYWNPIKASMPSDATQKPEWITLNKRKLSPRILWRDWQDAATLIGVRFGKTTTYGLLDIDKNSPYLNPTSLSQIRQTLETIGICRSLLIRSSWNGGVHLYLPLPKEVSSWSLQLALNRALTAQGFQVKAGHLEIFPNAKAFNAQYNGHRLPLQPASGSCLLDETLCPIDYSLERFLDCWEVAAIAQDRDLLDEALWSARSHSKKRTSQSQKTVDAWKRDLETDIEAGWTDFGQTNRLLKRIAEYGVVFEGLSGASLAEYIERIAISRPGFEEWCNHQTDIRQRSQSWAKAAENYYWQLGTERDRTGNLYTQFTPNSTNEKRAVEAQTRIYAAVAELDLRPFTITQRATLIMERVGCSKETLYKYKNLWHPDYVCLLDQQPVHSTEIGNLGVFEAENQNFLQSPKSAPGEEVRATPIYEEWKLPQGETRFEKEIQFPLKRGVWGENCDALPFSTGTSDRHCLPEAAKFQSLRQLAKTKSKKNKPKGFGVKTESVGQSDSKVPEPNELAQLWVHSCKQMGQFDEPNAGFWLTGEYLPWLPDEIRPRRLKPDEIRWLEAAGAIGYVLPDLSEDLSLKSNGRIRGAIWFTPPLPKFSPLEADWYIFPDQWFWCDIPKKLTEEIAELPLVELRLLAQPLCDFRRTPCFVQKLQNTIYDRE